jgi:site-specific recombinase XerC
MRTFKPKRKLPGGARVAYRHWYVEFRDHQARIRRLRAFTDRAASEELGRKLVRLADLRAAGEAPNRELGRFIERLPVVTREKLGKWGLLEPRQVTGSQPLCDLLDRLRESLRAAGRGEKHLRAVVNRTKAAFESCEFGYWSDIDALRLEQHLHQRREAGLSAKTSNHILASCRQFTLWVVQHCLATVDPLATLKPLNARIDPRRERRALSYDEELPKLIEAARAAPVYRGVSGPLRALVYKLAAETGLRVSELAGLRVRDLELAGERLSLTVPASLSKNRCEARQPLRDATAQELAGVVKGRLPTALALPLPKSFPDKATRWLRHDLELAWIPYQDESGRFADFHALRAAFITGLMTAGANAKVVQSLARHSSAELTVGLYTKLGRDDEGRALALLPDLPSSSPEAKVPRAETGTESVARCVAFGGGLDETQVDSPGPSTPKRGPERAGQGSELGGGGGSRTRVPESPHTDTSLHGGDGYVPSREQSPGQRGGECGVSAQADDERERLADLWPRLSLAVRKALLGIAEASAAQDPRAKDRP